MILTTHALTGAVIGKNINNIYLLILLSIIIHYAMDALRHGEYLNRKSSFKNTWWKVFLDIFLGLFLVLLMILLNPNNLTNNKIFHILLGVFFSMLPDLFTVLYWKLNIKPLKILFDFHAKIHKYPQNSPEREWTLKNARNDILISIVAILAFLFL